MGGDSVVSWRLQLKFVSIGAMVGRFDWQEFMGHEDMYETLFSRTSLWYSCIQGVWEWRGGVDNMSSDVTEGVL